MAIVAVEVLTTYWRTPPAELFHLASSGPDVGIHQALGILAFPTGLFAVAIAAIAVDQLPDRRAVVAAIATAILGVMVFLPGGLDETDLDARPVTLLPLVGVAGALGLTLLAVHRCGVGRFGPRLPGDCLRVGFGIALLVIGLPWMAADVGLSLDIVPGLGQVYLSDVVSSQPSSPAPYQAVHDGHHHGMDGVLIAAVALLLARSLVRMRSVRRRRLVSAYLSVLLVYGMANALEDAWVEQIVKRGWASWEPPKFQRPGLSVAWAGLTVTVVVVHATLLRGGRVLNRDVALPDTK